MRRKLQARRRALNRDPGPVAWSIALIGLLLPVVGIGLCLYGAVTGLRGDPHGWLWVGIGVGALAIDIVIDLAWAHPSVTISDQPQLNQRGMQLIGRRVTLREPIEGGTGRVQLGGTAWPIEGPDLPQGAVVKVVGARLNALIVEVADGQGEAGGE